MKTYPGQIRTTTSPSGIVWEYWFGLKSGKRVYLVAPVGSLNTWQFGSVAEVKAFVASK